MEGVTDFVWDATGRALYEEALAGLPDGDNAVRARLLAQMAVTTRGRRSPTAEPVSAEALAMAERVGDRAGRPGGVAGQADGAQRSRRTADRLALGDRMLATRRADRDDDAVLWGRLWRFDALAQLGDIDRRRGRARA